MIVVGIESIEIVVMIMMRIVVVVLFKWGEEGCLQFVVSDLSFRISRNMEKLLSLIIT